MSLQAPDSALHQEQHKTEEGDPTVLGKVNKIAEVRLREEP